jgi:hypothetical protein
VSHLPTAIATTATPAQGDELGVVSEPWRDLETEAAMSLKLIPSPHDIHWRARLSAVQDLLAIAHNADSVARAVLQLTVVLQDEWETRPDRPSPEEMRGVFQFDQVVQLLREAYSLLEHPDESTVDRREWLKSTEPFVRG